MKKKFLSKLLTMLLVASMIFTMLPASAIAYYDGGWSGLWNSQWNSWLDDSADEQDAEIATQATTADNSEFLRIFHLDCGRKYFSVTEIEGIIDKLAENSFTHLQLAFGNNALRFLLDDMGVAANDAFYDSDSVKQYIREGNESYYSSDTSVLSETDMDTIIGYANSRGIMIIPLLNSPGHMNAIFNAAKKLVDESAAYGNTSTTIDVTNERVVAFTQALIQKYITYFANKDCKYFNMGADEYGFAELSSDGYSAFVNYINNLATKITDAGMKPIAFNDGIYYKSSDSAFAAEAEKISRNIMVAYWTKGTNDASADELKKEGFTLLNNSNSWYYVLGDALYSEWAKGQWGYKDSKSALQSVSCTTLPDGSTADVAGCVLCVWCDYPKYSYDSKKVYDLIATMAASNKEYFPDPLEILNGQTGTLKIEKEMILRANGVVSEWTSSEPDVASVKALDETSATITGVSAGNAVITAKGTTGTAAYTVSVVDGSLPDVANNVEITLSVGETKTVSQSDDVTGDVGEFTKSGIASCDASYESGKKRLVEITSVDELVNGDYLIAASRNDRVLTGNVANNSSTEWNNRLSISSSAASISSTDLWTITKTGTVYTVRSSTGYLTIDNGTANVTNTSKSLTLNPCSGNSWSGWDINLNGYYLNQYGGSGSNYAAGYKANDASGSYDQGSCWKIYRITSGESQTNITFKGLKEGDTEIQIGNTLYKITVNPEDPSKAPDLPIQLWITNTPISIKDVTTKTSDTFYYNSPYSAPSGTNAYYLTIKAEDAHDINGVPLSALVPGGVIGQPNGTETTASDPNATNVFWKGTRLTSTDGKSGLQYYWQSDMSSSGSDFTYVRYYGGSWAVSADRKNWTTVTGEGSTIGYSKCREQIIAYYKMRTALTDEVTTDVVDWGGAISSEANTEFAVLDFAVKYQSGTRIPNSFPVIDKTRVYNTSGNVETEDVDSTTYRLVNEISVTNETEFEVYMITLTSTSGKIADSLSTSTAKYEYPVDTEAEKVTWVKSVDDLPDAYKDSSRWYTATTTKADSLTFNADDDKNVGGDPILPKIEIQEKYGMLITYYIRPKVVEDKLVVRYVEESNASVPFYSFDIAIKLGTVFSDPTDNFNDGKLTNYTVDGLKATETVTSDLSKMDGVPAAYRYADYTCTRVERSNDNKTLTLYYTFSRENNFIADFGLPIVITPGDINDTLKNNAGRITKVSAIATGGSARVDGNNVTFTPDETFGKDGATVTITYTGTNVVDKNENSITYAIGVIPASNVLYEEDFLTPGTVTGDISWIEHPASRVTTPQQSQMVNGDGSYNVFGYDDAYVKGTDQNPVTGELGVWKADGLTYSASTTALTTSFYGNGFDLIGNCGPNTCRVMLAIFKEGSARPVSVTVVDTRFTDSDIANILYQVPWAHVELKEEAQYNVEIYASGCKENSTNSISTYSTYSYAAPTDGFDSILASLGVSKADVEYINVADSANASSAAASKSVNAIATYANDAATGNTYEVEVSGFRVYRSSDNGNYPANEQNVQYVNILDAVDREFVAYAENKANSNATIETYENNGGPQNEIYLGENNYLIFALDGALAGTEIQVSLRAVSGVTAVTQEELSSNTEMYYTLKAVTMPETDEIVYVIANTSANLLAVGNLKLPAGVTVKGPSQLSEQTLLAACRMVLNSAPVDPEPEQPLAFEPEHFSIRDYATRLFRSKLVTLRIDFSSDVSYVTIDGVRYNPSRLASLFGYYTVTFTDTIGRNDGYLYKIVFYDANGNPSATQLVNGN